MAAIMEKMQDYEVKSLVDKKLVIGLVVTSPESCSLLRDEGDEIYKQSIGEAFRGTPMTFVRNNETVTSWAANQRSSLKPSGLTG